MSFYPQVGSGVVTQFPFSRSRQWRAITNRLESGELIALPDNSGGQMMWNLRYEDLSTAEIGAISGLFTAAQGQFGTFTFIDPLANLLGWSEALSNSAWQSSELTISAGVADPLGTNRASSIANGGPGSLSLWQTLGVSGDYVACFSVYVRSATAGNLILQRDGASKTVSTGTRWNRIRISGTGTAGAAQSSFALVLQAGQSIEVFGLQVEAQPAPSVYRPTQAAAGIYEETYFADDELTFTSTGPGLSRAAVNLISRL